MLMGKDENLIGHDPALVRHFAVAHNAAYQYCDIDILMASTSPRGGIWAGLLPPDLFVVNETPDEVRASYVELIKDFKVLPPTIFTMFCTDWYAIFEVTSQLVHRESGQIIDNQAVCLFGNDELGTTVDMAWPFGPEPGALRARRDSRGAMRSELLDLAAHDARLEGWRAGDVAQSMRGIAEKGTFFLPDFDQNSSRRAIGLSGRDQYETWLAALFGLFEIESIEALNIHVADRFVFSETLWRARRRGGGAAIGIRYALAEILVGEEVGGMLGFATLID
jgi:hypothetical protein